MQTVSIISVGKLKDAFFEMASNEYLKRLKSYAKVNIIEIKAGVLSENPKDSEINAVLEKEGEEIIKKIPPSAKVITLCIEGKLYSSEDLARLLGDTALSGISHIVFIIGGSYGLSEKVKSRSDIRLSMSKMTFPHRLARIMLLEQIYRGYKILGGEAYHK
ncbi:MAG: 23S rRNA (pseudouridine(1915)-N(3))-methyltransferase RlmH [Clostridia bacterium]|nr:23S rRNA (pseudouridine(1915)-N(3))-methyltransferase RlmH [Clostridia bacterium]